MPASVAGAAAFRRDNCLNENGCLSNGKEANVVAPNEQCVVNNKLVIVTLAGSGREASITVGPHGSPSHPVAVSIEPLLAGGLSERDALKYVMRVAQIATAGAGQ